MIGWAGCGVPSLTRIFCCLHLTPERRELQRSQDWARCGSGRRLWLRVKAFSPRKQGTTIPLMESPLTPLPWPSPCLFSVCVSVCVYECVCVCVRVCSRPPHRIILCRALQLMQRSFYQASRTSCRAARRLFVLDVFSYSCFSCKNNYGSENIFKNVV